MSAMNGIVLVRSRGEWVVSASLKLLVGTTFIFFLVATCSLLDDLLEEPQVTVADVQNLMKEAAILAAPGDLKE